MRDYQKVLSKRITKKFAHVPFIRLDEAFYVIFASDSMSRFNVSPKELNEENTEVSALFSPDSDQLLTLLAEMMEQDTKKAYTDVKFVSNEEACCFVYSFHLDGRDLPFFDCFFIKKDSGDFVMQLADAIALEADLSAKRFFDCFPLPIVFTENGNIQFSNRAFADRLGYKISIVHSTKLSQISSYNTKREIERVEQANLNSQIFATFPSQDGRVFKSEMISAVFDPEQHIHYNMMIDAEDKINTRRSLDIFISAVKKCDEGVVIISTDNTGYFWLNDSFINKTGFNYDNFSKLAVKYDTDEEFPVINDMLEHNRSWKGFRKFHRSDGTYFEAELDIYKIYDDYICMILKDNTKHFGLERMNKLYHETDYLTGLSNSDYFEKNLHYEYIEAQKADTRLNFMMFSFDDYNDIFFNDSPEVANGVLKLVALRAKNMVDRVKNIGRLGECRFGVIFEADDEEEIKGFCENFLVTMETPLIYSDREFTISIYAGVCSYPDNCDSIGELYNNARYALRTARASSNDNSSSSSYSIYHRKEKSEGVLNGD